MQKKPLVIRLEKQLPKDQWPTLLGKKLERSDVDLIVEQDADVYTPEGEILFKFRKSCLPETECVAAFQVLRTIRLNSMNRGLATGKWAKIKGDKGDIKLDGSKSLTVQVPRDYAVESGVIGFMDRYIRTPLCRQTAWTMENPEKFAKVIPFLQAVSRAYEEAAPDRWRRQASRNAATHPAWVIPGTQFTTITVNRNWQTAVHTDEGDFKDGLSCITALRAGHYTGCELVFPHYRCGVDLRTGDVLMFNSHHMHGNLPLRGRVNEFERISLVLYVREKMNLCRSPEEEVEQAKNRKKGQPLW